MSVQAAWGNEELTQVAILGAARHCFAVWDHGSWVLVMLIAGLAARANLSSCVFSQKHRTVSSVFDL